MRKYKTLEREEQKQISASEDTARFAHLKTNPPTVTAVNSGFPTKSAGDVHLIASVNIYVSDKWFSKIEPFQFPLKYAVNDSHIKFAVRFMQDNDCARISLALLLRGEGIPYRYLGNQAYMYLVVGKY